VRDRTFEFFVLGSAEIIVERRVREELESETYKLPLNASTCESNSDQLDATLPNALPS